MAPIDELFSLFDENQDGSMGFDELRRLFQSLAPDQGAQSAANAAAESLLMTDAEMDHLLSRSEFEALLRRVLGVAGMSLEEGLPRLLEAARSARAAGADTQAMDQDEGEAVLRVASAIGAGPALATLRDVSSLSDDDGGRGAAHWSQNGGSAASDDALMQQLFRLWDSDCSGRVSFKELAQGLAKLRPPSDKKALTTVLTESARALTAHDQDGDHRLDASEFADFIHGLMVAAGYQRTAEPLSELIELTQRQADNPKLAKLLDAQAAHIEAALAGGG